MSEAQHKTWNQNLINNLFRTDGTYHYNNIIHRKIFRQIKDKIISNNNQLMICGKQNSIVDDPFSLDIKGVIYIIVHLPTSHMYIGQTINSAYHRLKQHHKTRGDKKNSLHYVMKDQPLDNFLTIPIEIIEPTDYHNEDPKINIRNFRRFASIRERYHIFKYVTMVPFGFNSNMPYKLKLFKRGKKKPNLWYDRWYAKKSIANNLYITRTINENNERIIKISTIPGPYERVRKTLAALMDIKHDTNPENLKQEISSMSLNYI